MKAKIVFGMGFGDEGKGTIVDFLCHHLEYNLVVRYAGGAQSGHNVVRPDRKHHMFSQIGAGSFNKGVSTLIGPDFKFDPIALYNEMNKFGKVNRDWSPERMFVDSRAPVVTKYHILANVARERIRRKNEGKVHGSCGMGIGELGLDLEKYPEDILRAGDLLDVKKTAYLLERIRYRKFHEIFTANGTAELPENVIEIRDEMSSGGNDLIRYANSLRGLIGMIRMTTLEETRLLLQTHDCVFESSQGILLDQGYGFHPHYTWSDVTPLPAIDLLQDAGLEPGEIIGVTRRFHTRHGAGPLPTEIHLVKLPFEHNKTNEFQEEFRIGIFDGVLFSHACKSAFDSIPDEHHHRFSLAVTHMDIDSFETNGVCEHYVKKAHGEYMERSLEDALKNSDSILPYYRFIDRDSFAEYIEKKFGVPVLIQSFGPATDQKEMKT